MKILNIKIESPHEINDVQKPTKNQTTTNVPSHIDIDIDIDIADQHLLTIHHDYDEVHRNPTQVYLLPVGCW